MLGLKMATDPRWVNIVEKNIQEILSDHAYCEQKAASNAISLIVRYPEYPELVKEMTAIAVEEMEHFGMVHNKILERGMELGFERPDPYVKDLFKFSQGGNRLNQLVDRLLVGAMIEARSCERFKILSEEINDEDLRIFYRDLMESEARHYTTFLKHARAVAGDEIDVDKKWKAFLDYEAEVVSNYGKKETMHG